MYENNASRCSYSFPISVSYRYMVICVSPSQGLHETNKAVADKAMTISIVFNIKKIICYIFRQFIIAATVLHIRKTERI